MPKKKELSYIILSIKIKNITLQHYSFNSVSTTSYIYIYILLEQQIDFNLLLTRQHDRNIVPVYLFTPLLVTLVQIVV